MLNMVLDLLLKQIFGQPFILMALIVLVGYIAMGQKMSKALTGSIKASIGILVMGMGSGALIGNFGKLIVALQTSTGITGAGLNTYPTMTAGYEVMDSVLGAGTGASWGIYTLLVAFILNLIYVALRKFTRIRAVYLTGNAMIVQAGVSTFLVWKFLGTGMLPTILIASVLTSLYWGICSTMLIEPTHLITGVDCAAIFAFAPKSVVLGLLFGTLGQVIGLILLLIFKSPIFLVPGFIPLFFDNATIAIFANKFGGWKAAAIICTANGLVQIIGSMLAVKMTGLTWWQGSADYATIWVVVIAALKGLGSMLGIPVA